MRSDTFFCHGRAIRYPIVGVSCCKVKKHFRPPQMAGFVKSKALHVVNGSTMDEEFDEETDSMVTDEWTEEEGVLILVEEFPIAKDGGVDRMVPCRNNGFDGGSWIHFENKVSCNMDMVAKRSWVVESRLLISTVLYITDRRKRNQ